MKIIKVGSDFSGVGAFDQALMRLGIKYETIFACDIDKYARQTYIHNYGEPKYYPENVYNREIPKLSLDIYMTSPPCQAFSNEGSRLGEKDERGILFYNSLEFIKKNKPKTFIIENVKGLLTHDKGKTFEKWLSELNKTGYNINYKVINSKDFGIPQNRDRVFIVGTNFDFKFPESQKLTLSIKDILEQNVDESYNVPESTLDSLDIIFTNTGISYRANTKKGIDYANFYDTISLSFPNSKTRRGRVGKGIVNTLTTSCDYAVILPTGLRRLTPRECYRLMGYRDSFIINKSNSQAYKQAGNSIVVNVLAQIINKLNLF